MRARANKLIAVGMLCFSLGLIICVLLKPVGLGVNSGISYFGNYRLTIVPYAIAILGYGLINILLARCISAKELWPLKHSLYVLAVLSLIITITPYSVSSLLDNIHTATGTVLFLLQLILSGWLIIKMHYDRWPIVFSGLMLASGIAAAFYIEGPHGFLIQAQIVFQWSFAAVLYTAVNNLIPANTKAS